jgi:hypothetical protein
MATLGILLRVTTRRFPADDVVPRRWPKARRFFRDLERRGWRIRAATERNHLLWSQSGTLRTGIDPVIVLPDERLPWMPGSHAEQCLVLALLRVFQVRERVRGGTAVASIPAMSLACFTAHRLMHPQDACRHRSRVSRDLA